MTATSPAPNPPPGSGRGLDPHPRPGAADGDRGERRRGASPRGRFRFASPPTGASLENFDHDAASGLDPNLLAELGACRFLENTTNVLLIGPPGVGRTHIATGLGHAAVNVGYRVYFTFAADLAAIEGKWSAKMRFFAGPTPLIIDELGYLLGKFTEQHWGKTVASGESPTKLRTFPSIGAL
ncbi:ATP-binding protein [Brachybacterium vulturis]|uniref:ATP-binding protein n=1 Tax=Brachybacterium vulturis TaxID=2017484 RepID=UPI001FE525EB|nr:ATP-binding protein [Brachybacterium vulturis]